MKAILFALLLPMSAAAQNYSSEMCPGVQAFAEVAARSRAEGLPASTMMRQVDKADLDPKMRELVTSIVRAAYTQPEIKPDTFARLIGQGCYLNASRK